MCPKLLKGHLYIMTKRILAALICAAVAFTMTACATVPTETNGTSSNRSTTSTNSSSNSTTVSSSDTYSSIQDEPSEPEEPSIPETSAEYFKYYEDDGEITITEYIGSDTDVVIPQEINGKPVSIIGEKAFCNNWKITSVTIPYGVTTIGYLAFSGCGQLTDINIPESVTEFTCHDILSGGTYSSLVNHFFKSSSPFINTPWLINKRKENPLVIVNNMVIDGQECTRKVEVPDGVKIIAGGAFEGCTTITELTLPKSLRKIGDYAFYGCERLTNIILPDNVTEIGDFAFYSCRVLEDIVFPQNTVDIGLFAFGDAVQVYYSTTPWLEKLTEENPLVIVNDNLINAQRCSGDIIIPNTVKSVAAGAFIDSKVQSVSMPNTITKIKPFLFYRCRELANFSIPENVTEIGRYAFGFEVASYGNKLESITIPNSVIKIDDHAFYSNNLKDVTLSENLVKIDDFAFDWCSELTNISFPDTLTSIGRLAFSAPFETITLPNSLKSLGEDAFNRDTDIFYKGEIYYPELHNELYAAINGE